MNLPTLKDNATAEELLGGIEDYIAAANTVLDAGDMVDLAGLDAVIDALCARVVKLSPEDGRPFADKFDVLHDRLGALQDKMVAVQAQIRSELEQSSVRQKASRAYLKDNK